MSSVIERVHAVLSDLPPIGKNSRASQQMGGYAFRGIEDITAALKPLLAKHGVFMVPTVTDRRESSRQTKAGSALYIVDLLVRFTFYGTDGDDFAAEVWGQGSDAGDKATQKAMTSAFKSMLSITFCISDAEYDTEAHDVPETTEARAPEGFESAADAKAALDRVRKLAIDADLAGWVRDQDFGWPWSRAACDAIEAKAKTVLEASGADRQTDADVPTLTSASAATPIEPAAVKTMSNISVIQALKTRGLSVEGTRDDLKVRLIGALEQEAPFKEEII